MLFKYRFSFFQGIPELVIIVSFLLLRERQRPTNSSLSVRFVLFPPNILGTLFIFITTLLQSSSSQQVACWLYKNWLLFHYQLLIRSSYQSQFFFLKFNYQFLTYINLINIFNFIPSLKLFNSTIKFLCNHC